VGKCGKALESHTDGLGRKMLSNIQNGTCVELAVEVQKGGDSGICLGTGGARNTCGSTGQHW
jgi:hypothetical protein